MCVDTETGATSAPPARETSMRMIIWTRIKEVRYGQMLAEAYELQQLTGVTGEASFAAPASTSKSGLFYDAARNGYR